MKKLIASVKAKPAHIRERIVFATAGSIAGLVGIIWISGVIMSDPFSLNDTGTFGAREGGNTLGEATSFLQDNVAAVTGAFQGLSQQEQENQTGEARIEVVDKGAYVPVEDEETGSTVVTF